MKTVAEVIGVSRSNLIERMRKRAKKRIGRPPLPDDKLVAEIKAVSGIVWHHRAQPRIRWQPPRLISCFLGHRSSIRVHST